MTNPGESIELRSVQSGAVDRDQDCLHLEALIEVGGFSGQGVFLARQEIVAEFVEQLEDLEAGVLATARLECGLVARSADVVYFSCQIDRADVGAVYLVQVSLGTAGPAGLLQRLHVGLRLNVASLVGFHQDLSGLLLNRQGNAVLRESQPNPRLQPPARISSSEKI